MHLFGEGYQIGEEFSSAHSWGKGANFLLAVKILRNKIFLFQIFIQWGIYQYCSIMI